MKEEIAAIHVLFVNLLVLISVLTSNDKVILRGDKPTELFEPEDLPVLVGVF